MVPKMIHSFSSYLWENCPTYIRKLGTHLYTADVCLSYPCKLKESNLLFTKQRNSFFLNVHLFLRQRERERERERENEQGRAEREGDTESEAGARL